MVTQCDPVDAQRWTDGVNTYSDDGSYSIWGTGRGSPHDLVSFVGLLPDKPQSDQAAEIDRLRAELQQTQVWCTAATDAHSQSEVQRIEMQAEIERLQAEVLQAQKYVSEANEKINQQSTEIKRLNRNVEEFEKIDENKDSEIDHLRQLRRTNDAIIKELRTLLTYALSKK
jgi:chromosome segregation ATPase